MKKSLGNDLFSSEANAATGDAFDNSEVKAPSQLRLRMTY